MTNEEKLSKALQDFKTKYQSVTSADLQTFILGWQEAVKNCFIPDVSGSAYVITNAKNRIDGVTLIEQKAIEYVNENNRNVEDYEDTVRYEVVELF